MRSYLIDCLKIEEMLADIYRKLAGVNSYSAGLRETLERMAQDEDDHARQMEIARGVPEEVFFEAPRLDQEKLDDLRRRAQHLLEMADAPPPSEHKVLKIAKNIERDFMQVHLQNAVKFREPSLVELFKGLAREDEKHAATLKAYCGKNRVPDDT